MAESVLRVGTYYQYYTFGASSPVDVDLLPSSLVTSHAHHHVNMMSCPTASSGDHPPTLWLTGSYEVLKTTNLDYVNILQNDTS